MSNIAAHIGIHHDNLPIIRKMSTESPVGVGVFIDGDGWAEWGEPRDNGVNRPDAYHVTVYGSDLPSVLGLIRRHLTDEIVLPTRAGYLNPERDCRFEWAEGRLSITLADDWSEKILERPTLTPTVL